jgi:hypothetical protein
MANENIAGFVLMTKCVSFPYLVYNLNQYDVRGDNPVRSKVVASL